MNDTQKQIKKYKGMLPHLKEKVAAVSVLLAMSATMLTTVSFAWLALSQSPEVSGAHTAIASNGNLEIALATGTMSEWIAPNASQVGDSGLVLDQRNITWGNLINLSDPIYGLDNLVLRPALLNKSDLLRSPLYGAVYGKDGRIEKLTSNFGFASWVPSDGVTAGYFNISDQLGVRAISSTKLDSNVGPYATKYQLMKTAAVDANATAGDAYIAITNNEAWMPSLATLMGTYMTVRMNPSSDDMDIRNPSVAPEDVENLRDMFGAFVDAFELEAEALAKLANFQLFVINGGDDSKYVPYTGETLMTKTQAQLKAQGIQITNFTGTNSFVSDYNKLIINYEKLVDLANQGTIKWFEEFDADDSSKNKSTLQSIVNDLVAVGQCTVQVVGSSAEPVKIDSLGASNAMGYLDKSCNAVITNGLLNRFEERTGQHMQVGKNYNNGKGLTIKATVHRSIIKTDGTVYAIITTNAGNNSLFSADLKYAEGLNTGDVGSVVAKDTYGLAVDLWVRTNAAGSYLTLQGNVLTKEEEVQVMGQDAEGNEVEIYALTLTDPNDSSVTYTIDLYKNGDVWYNAQTHDEYTLEEGQTPNKKKEIIKTVIGYEGANRVWDESAGLSVNSTTQGSGSCYVYYADTPEDQARSLALLSQLRVAFVAGDGTLLAEAYLDTANYFAENGKVIVPLVLDPTSCKNLGTDAEGNSIYAITALEQNVATRISAIVYLDGAELENDDVLSSSDIQGQLNIQFGSTTNLQHFENEKLKLSEIKFSASILEGSSFDYDKVVGDMLTKVGVTIDGDQPKTVTAFFLRMISDTQGSREKEMTFTYNESTKRWEATHKFTAPGNYIIRSIQLDGIEYDLNQENLPQVTINGFTIESLTWAYGNQPAQVMTADSSVTESVSVKFASDDVDKMPKTVVGQFVRKSDQAVASVKFTYNPTTAIWEGDVSFVSSGEYTLTYLVLDGKHNTLPEGMQKTITIYIGMKVAVYTKSPIEFKYEGSSMPDDRQNLYMQVRIMDDTGAPMLGQTNVTLQYKMKGSSLTENGMYTELTWNASSGYYEGAFKSKVGMYEFSSVSVGGNMITRDTTSPEFMIISPEPPSFDSGNTPDYQYAPDPTTNPAKLSVLLENADALPYIRAVVTKNGVEQEEWLEGTLASGSWVFYLPIASDGGQDGVWAIKEIRIAGVFSKEGVLYTEENPLIFDMTNKSGVSSTVVSKVKVSFTKPTNLNVVFGKDGNTVTGTFLQSYDITGITAVLTDNDGNPIRGIGDEVKLIYNYDGNTSEMGGYTSNAVTATTGIMTITLKKSDDGETFVQSSEQSIQYAGKYELSALTFSVGGNTTTKNDNNTIAAAPKYEVWSVKPSVTISSVSPNTTTSIPTKITWTKSTFSLNYTLTDNKTNELDTENNTVTVYAKATTGSDGESVGTGDAGFARPQLTFVASGIDGSTQVTFTIPKGSSTNEISVKLTGSKSETYTLGSTAQVYNYNRYIYSCSVRGYFGHGDQTIKEVTVTSNGVQYKVTLDKPIIIHNPSSVNKTS